MFFQLNRHFFSTRADNSSVEQHVDEIGDDVIQQTLVVGDQDNRTILGPKLVDPVGHHFHRVDIGQLEERDAQSDRAWITPIRKAALARFSELGFPTTRHEDWKYTNVTPLSRMSFLPAESAAASISREELSTLETSDRLAARLVFVNGGVKRLLKNYLAPRSDPTDPLFRSHRARRIGARQVELRLACWLALAGITSRCTVHTLRHTFATRLYEKTSDLGRRQY